MQLIVNTESTDTEKMSTIDQESLIEKAFVNGSQEINDVIIAIHEQETPIANKENIQVEENKIINIVENRNPERTEEVSDEDKSNVHTKEEAKKSIDDAAVTNEDCKQLTQPDHSIIKNGTGDITYEIDENKAQIHPVQKNECSKNYNIKHVTENNAENEIVKGENKNDDDTIVKEVQPVKDTQLLEETENDSLKENKSIENVDDGEQEVEVINSEVNFNEVKEKNSECKNILEENSHEVTVAVCDSLADDEVIIQKATNDSCEAILDLGEKIASTCPNDEDPVRQENLQISTISEDDVHSVRESDSAVIVSDGNCKFKEPSVHVADISDAIVTGDIENTEIVKETLDTEVITMVNNSAKLTEDVEMVNAECKINDIDAIEAEDKSESAQIVEHVEMVNLEDKNKDDADNQAVIEMDISENVDKTTIESTKHVETDVKNKVNDDRQVTTVETVKQNEDKDISPKNVKIDSVKDENINISTVHDIVDLDEIKIVEDDHNKDTRDKSEISRVAQKVEEKTICTPTIRLSNTLDILSDDDEEPANTIPPEPSKVDIPTVASPVVSEKCINLDDDDDIMLIDDVTSSNDKEKIPEVTAETAKLSCDVAPVNSKEIEESKVPVTGSNLGKGRLLIN